MQLQIEAVNHCNAKCVFCPYPKMQRAKGVMDLGLYKKIVDDAATIPRINHLTITGLGEPLLDRFLDERLIYSRKALPPGTLIDIYTNGSPMTPDRFDKLLKTQLDVVYVSLNGTDPVKRKQIMGLDDHEKVCSYIDYAIEKCKGTRTRVIVKTVLSKDLMEPGEAEDFKARWGGLWDKGGNAYLHLEGNWAGAMWPMRVPPTQACSRALDEIMVMWDGRVSLCCFDGEGEVVFGDLNKQKIREVFNAGLALEYREAHASGRRNTLRLCKDCTAI